MTSLPPLEPLEAFAIPDDAIVLPRQRWTETADQPERQQRQLALAALRQAMADRELRLPLGPELDPEDPERLLALNHFSVQLATTGLLSDEVNVLPGPWQRGETAPQLLLVAAVDAESAVVQFPGVLTAAEVVAAVGRAANASEPLVLPIETLRGGIERLFTLVQLLDPAAIPRQSLRPVAASAGAVSVLDWLLGLLPPALDELGANLIPATAGAFRGVALAPETRAERALAILSIPLGLTGAGDLVTGDPARRCIERFQLLLIPTGEPAIGAELNAERLSLRLVGELQGDLLPDGLVLSAIQGSRRQSVSSSTSTLLELELPAADELIEVSLTPPGGSPLVLPPLQLPFS
ncbi:hypothetical protein [Cyanobium sp. NS01]|uniref:hypothetical protein n=1 Tax=Cyanobium sp. NS01 TaxID=261284 RepID=UPI001647C3AD|nr:hypothetical protein [Cyanobium sp. NS01]QNI71998.1 hypothetical protein CyaNS01_02904 [Cyanobium sp. NS01]